MAIPLTPEECAREILRVFIEEFGCRENQVLPLASFSADRFRRCDAPVDFRLGLEFGIENGWLAIDETGEKVRLLARRGGCQGLALKGR